MTMTNDSKKVKILIAIIILLVILILLLLTLFGVFPKMKNNEDSKIISSEKLTVYSKNEKEDIDWNTMDTIVVDPGDIEVDSYSFDGGLNWQKSNEYTITSNGKFNIILKDKEGNKTASKSYTINTIDNIAPIITVTLPSQIQLNEEVDLNKYVTAEDSISGIEEKIHVSPSTLDTTTLGNKIINYSVKDKAGNFTSISISVNIIEKIEEEMDSDKDSSTNNNNTTNNNKNDSNNNSSNNNNNNNNTSNNVEYITMYRYRVKKTNTYTCKTYDCSYYDEKDTVEKIKSYTETGKCNNDYNEKITFRNGCYITPTAPGTMCTQAFITKDRYTLYDDNYIDIYALLTDGTQYNRNKTSSQSKDDYKYSSDSNSKNYTPITTPSQEYKKAPCGKNELEIHGYCHAICKTPTYTCPTGYTNVDGTCKKHISKTCSDTCTNYTWSSWSSWSESRIIATDEIQVETKVIKK